MYDEKVERTCQGQTNDIKCCWIGDEYQVVDDDEIFMEEVGQQVCNWALISFLEWTGNNVLMQTSCIICVEEFFKENTVIFQVNDLKDLLVSSHSTHQIACSTGLKIDHQQTMLQALSKPIQALWWLSIHHYPTDMYYTVCLIGTRKAENAVQITKTLQDAKNHSISPQVALHYLRKAGIKAMVKQNAHFSLSIIGGSD